MRFVFSSISTIATELVNDMHFLQSEKLDIDSFMEEYGHLRPGTYDITSLRYDQMSEFGQMDFQMLEKKDDQKFELTKQKEKRIDLLLKKEGFTKITCQKLFKYIENAKKHENLGNLFLLEI